MDKFLYWSLFFVQWPFILVGSVTCVVTEVCAVICDWIDTQLYMHKSSE